MTAAVGVIFVFLEDVQTDHSLADWEVGVIAGAGFGTALVTQLVMSPLADRGRSTGLIVAALLAGVLGPIGFAYGSSMTALAASRGASGVAVGLFGLLARKALLGLDATGGGSKLGLLLSAAIAGFISGPFIGAALEPLGFEAPFLLVSASLAAIGIPTGFIISRAEVAIAPVDYSDLRRLLARPKVQAAMLVQAVVYGYIGVFDALIDRFLTDLGASTAQVAGIILIVGGPMLVLPRYTGALADRFGGARVMIPGLLGLMPAMAGYGLSTSLVAAAAFGFLHGFSESFSSIGAQVVALEVTGAERAAVGTALLDGSGQAAAALGAGVSPLAYGALGGDVFLVAGAIGLVIGLAATVRVRQGSEEPLGPAPRSGPRPVGQAAGPS